MIVFGLYDRKGPWSVWKLLGPGEKRQLSIWFVNEHPPTKAISAKTLYQSGEKTVKEIAQGLGISRATCYQYIELMKEGNYNKDQI